MLVKQMHGLPWWPGVPSRSRAVLAVRAVPAMGGMPARAGAVLACSRNPVQGALPGMIRAPAITSGRPKCTGRPVSRFRLPAWAVAYQLAGLAGSISRPGGSGASLGSAAAAIGTAGCRDADRGRRVRWDRGAGTPGRAGK